MRLSADWPAKARRYAPEHLNFATKHIKLLKHMGYIRRNPQSHWSSPVLIVAKPEQGVCRFLKSFYNIWSMHQCLPAGLRLGVSGNFLLQWTVRRFTLLGSLLPNVSCRKVQTLPMHSKLGCIRQWIVCYSLALWFGSMTYWSTQYLSMSIFETWEKYSRDFSSSTSSCTPKRATCLVCILSDVGVRYPRRDYRSILPIWKGSRIYLVRRPQSIYCVFSAQSIGSKVRFQTMHVM